MARRMRLGESLTDAQPVGVFVGEHWCSVRGDATMVMGRRSMACTRFLIPPQLRQRSPAGLLQK